MIEDRGFLYYQFSVFLIIGKLVFHSELSFSFLHKSVWNLFLGFLYLKTINFLECVTKIRNSWYSNFRKNFSNHHPFVQAPYFRTCFAKTLFIFTIIISYYFFLFSPYIFLVISVAPASICIFCITIKDRIEISAPTFLPMLRVIFSVV